MEQEKGFIAGLKYALEMAYLHKGYSQDIDYMIATLEKTIKKKKTV